MANPSGKNQYTGRASGHAELHKTIKAGTKGVNQGMTIAAYRHTAAKALVNNRKMFQGMPPSMKTEMLYKTATATVSMRKSEWAKASQKLSTVHRNK